MRVFQIENDWGSIPGHNGAEFAVARAAEVIERRAISDAAARAWWRVALTLAEANHAHGLMLKPKYMTHPPVRFDFLPRAMAMFPDDIDFRFCEARLHASSVSALLELASPQPGVRQVNPDTAAIGYGYMGVLSRRQQESLDQARPLLATLIQDPVAGPVVRERRMRPGGHDRVERQPLVAGLAHGRFERGRDDPLALAGARGLEDGLGDRPEPREVIGSPRSTSAGCAMLRGWTPSAST